jgi:hypothetical protein
LSHSIFTTLEPSGKVLPLLGTPSLYLISADSQLEKLVA